MNKFDHGAQIACVSSLLGFLRKQKKTIEDCKIVIDQRVDQEDFQIEYFEYAEQFRILFESLGANSKKVHVIHASEEDSNLIEGADVFINFSDTENLSDVMLMSLAENPIVMTMDPCDNRNAAVAKRADDAIIFTGGKSLSSLIFPYMTRAVLETEAREINIPMKIAAAKALDEITKRDKYMRCNDMNSITEAII